MFNFQTEFTVEEVLPPVLLNGMERDEGKL